MKLQTLVILIAAAALNAQRESCADTLIIQRSGEMTSGELIEINDQQIVVLRDGSVDERISAADCVALFDDRARQKFTDRGLLVLADGQQFPGEAISGGKSGGQALVWSHKLFGRIEVPLGLVRSVNFIGTDTPPPAHAMDVLELTNGDRVEGVVLSLGDPVTLSIGGSAGRQTTQPLARVASVSLVSPRRPITGKRVWLKDGTIVDVSQLRLGHDGRLRLTVPSDVFETSQLDLNMNEMRAALFDATGVIPLALLTPTSVDGPRTRYELPRPKAIDPAAPIGLSPIQISGPLTLRYELPGGSAHFVADAALPASHRAWGDFELVILDDDREVLRSRLNRNHPAESIRLRLVGSELTIRIEEGANGPLQDTVVLQHAMLLEAR